MSGIFLFQKVLQKVVFSCKNMSLRPRLIIFYLVSILIPLVVFGGILYQVSIDEVESETKKVSLQSVIQVNKVLDEYVNQIDKIAQTLYIDTAIPKYLVAASGQVECDKATVLKKKESAYTYIVNLMAINQDIWSVSMVTLKNDVVSISKNGYEKPMFDFYKDKYYLDLKESTGQKVLLPIHKTNYMFSPPRSVFSLGRRYLDTGIGMEQGLNIYVGYFLVECSEAVLDRICNDVKISSDGFFLILDDHSKPMYSSQKDILQGSNYEKIIGAFPQKAFDSIATIGQSKVVLVRNTSKDTGWTVVEIIPYKEVTGRGKNIKNVFIILSIVCIIMVLAASALISRGVTKPIKNLQKAMRDFEKGKTEVQVNIKSSNEVGELSKSFNRLIGQVNGLIMSIRSIEIKKREAELDALRSQINPHFLYNTLDSIRMMAVIDDNKRIAAAVKALADLFRYSIKQKKDIVEIKHEITHIRNYIFIQKIRYGKKFDVAFDIDEEIYDYKTLKFILQPIVENAIIHGLEKKREKGLLTIRVKKDDDHVLFNIMDSGVGMSEEALENLRTYVREYGGDDTVSIGLKNINDRITLYFGTDCGLRFESTLNEGTSVQFRIPAFIDEGWVLGNVIGISRR